MAAPQEVRDASWPGWAPLSESDRHALDEGQVVVRMLDVVNAKDIASLAAVKVAAPKARVMRWLLTPETRRRGSVLASGEIPAADEERDLSALVVGETQARELRDCRRSDCGMKLPGDAIDELRALGGSSNATMSDVASRVLRHVLLRAADRFRREGTAGLPTYLDRPQPVPVLAALRGLRAAAPALDASLAALGLRLAEDPPAAGRLVWSQEKLWKRIVITLDHEVVAEPSAGQAVLLSTRLYANHYFEGSISVTGVLETAGGCYLTSLNLSRSDHKGDGFSGLERALVNLLVRRRLRAQWGEARAQLESTRQAGE
jgi:hypothetical protein